MARLVASPIRPFAYPLKQLPPTDLQIRRGKLLYYATKSSVSQLTKESKEFVSLRWQCHYASGISRTLDGGTGIQMAQ